MPVEFLWNVSNNFNLERCPFTKCNQRLPLDIIRSVLGDEEFRRWERLAFQVHDSFMCRGKSFDVLIRNLWTLWKTSSTVHDVSFPSFETMLNRRSVSVPIACFPSASTVAIPGIWYPYVREHIGGKIGLIYFKGDCPKEEEPSDDKADKEDEEATDPASALARKRQRDEHLSLQAVKKSSTKCPGCRSPVQKIAG